MTVVLPPLMPGIRPMLQTKPFLPEPAMPPAMVRDSFSRQGLTSQLPISLPQQQAILQALWFLAQQQLAVPALSQATQPQSPAAYIPPVPPAAKLPGYHSLRIVYNNDPHEKFKALPYLVSAFSEASRQGDIAGRDVLRLNSGDNNVGKEAHEWALNVRLMNMIRYHAVTMGNHELDLGSPFYAHGLAQAEFPTVVSNFKIQPGSELARRVQEGKIRTAPQILRDKQGTYGLIGITTPELKKVVSNKAKMQGETVQSFEETVETVKAQVNWLQQAGVNKILVLSHMGYDQDQKLARTVPGIDIIVGGHSHDMLEGIAPGANYLQTPTGEPVLIVQAGKNAEYMGVADVLFDPQGRVIPQQHKLFSPYKLPPNQQAMALRDSVLGPPKVMANIQNEYDCNDNQYHSDTVGQFTADAMRAASNADIAFVRSSEIRSNIDPGLMTDHDVKELMPFKDSIVRVKYSGAEIMDSLNRSAQGLARREAHPGMLHPSGMAFALNQKTGKVQVAYVFNQTSRQWEQLNPNKTYSVALGEFSVSNKEFPAFSHPERIEWNSGQPLQAFFELGLKRAGAPHQPITFQDDGRLQIVSG